MMEEHEFRKLVVNMRIAQKNYFRVRSTENLLLSKKYEAEVDEELGLSIPPKKKKEESLNLF